MRWFCLWSRCSYSLCCPAHRWSARPACWYADMMYWLTIWLAASAVVTNDQLSKAIPESRLYAEYFGYRSYRNIWSLHYVERLKMAVCFSFLLNWTKCLRANVILKNRLSWQYLVNYNNYRKRFQVSELNDGDWWNNGWCRVSGRLFRDILIGWYFGAKQFRRH